MGVEAGVGYIDDLVVTNPESTDVVAEGDDHLRLIKAAVKGSFTSLGSEAVIKTAAEINNLVGDGDTGTTLNSPVINTGISGSAILDEDDMSSDSATQLSTQQSIKAYIDNSINNITGIHGIRVNPNGTTASASPGISSSLSGATTYIITHNFGDTNYSVAAINGDATKNTALVQGISANSFQILLFDLAGTFVNDNINVVIARW